MQAQLVQYQIGGEADCRESRRFVCVSVHVLNQTWKDSGMSEKKVVMSAAVNWQNEITTIAGPFDGNRKGWLSRAARRANTTYRQMKSLYYGECSNPRHNVAANILSAADQARIQEARRDALKAAEFFDRRAVALAHVDEDFHRSEIDAFVEAARLIRSGSRSGNSGGVK